MNEDKISATLGIRTLAETQAEDTLQANTASSNTNVLDGSESSELYGKQLLVENQETERLPTTKNDEENIKDLELARENVKNIIELGDEAVAEMVEIAKQSESPRAFEVVSTLMKTLLDANKDYVEISTKKKYAKDEAEHGRPETNITNNNLIVSTADLLKMIKGEDK